MYSKISLRNEEVLQDNHQDGRETADRRRPLRRARLGRCTYGNARLQPVYGQPGAGERGRYRVLHVHPQLPGTTARTAMCTWVRPSWPPSALSMEVSSP